MHFCLVVVTVCQPLVHRHLLRIREEEEGVAVAVAAAVRPTFLEEAVVAVAVAEEGHHHLCSLGEAEVGEGVRTGQSAGVEEEEG
jgi:hypothetical protein